MVSLLLCPYSTHILHNRHEHFRFYAAFSIWSSSEQNQIVPIFILSCLNALDPASTSTNGLQCDIVFLIHCHFDLGASPSDRQLSCPGFSGCEASAGKPQIGTNTDWGVGQRDRIHHRHPSSQDRTQLSWLRKRKGRRSSSASLVGRTD